MKDLTSLQELSLISTKVTDKGLAHLKGLTRLKRLTLNGTRVSDAGLLHLKDLTGLQELNLYRTGVTDAGAGAPPKGMPKLTIKWKQKLQKLGVPRGQTGMARG